MDDLISPMDADCIALIEAGWGSHPRQFIPLDWQTRRGPDSPWFGRRDQIAQRQRRRTYAELRAMREAERSAGEAARD